MTWIHKKIIYNSNHLFDEPFKLPAVPSSINSTNLTIKEHPIDNQFLHPKKGLNYSHKKKIYNWQLKLI